MTKKERKEIEKKLDYLAGEDDNIHMQVEEIYSLREKAGKYRANAWYYGILGAIWAAYTGVVANAYKDPESSPLLAIALTICLITTSICGISCANQYEKKEAALEKAEDIEGEILSLN